MLKLTAIPLIAISASVLLTGCKDPTTPSKEEASLFKPKPGPRGPEAAAGMAAQQQKFYQMHPELKPKDAHPSGPPPSGGQ
jgi:hypothetical protein